MNHSILTQTIFILIILGIFTEKANAQWTEKDSIWLQDILSGKRKLKLNPEIQKQIESGAFINFEDNKQLQVQPSLKSIISMDFSEIIQPVNTLDDTVTSIFSSKVRMYNSSFYLKHNTLPSFYISPEERQRLRNSLPAASTFNAENMLRYLFWKSHRNKMRNKKKANAWKHYNLE